jgi:hypothetical protein
MKTDKFIVEKVDTCPDDHKVGVLYVAKMGMNQNYGGEKC